MIWQDRNIILAIKGSPGYSLVEFLVAMLILALVSLSWLTIIQVQSANRESYRREAVERLAGMMDVISQRGLDIDVRQSAVVFRFKDGIMTESTDSDEVKTVVPLFLPSESSIGYRLMAKKFSDVKALIPEAGSFMEKRAPVLVGELFEQSGTLDDEETNLGERIWRTAVVLRKSAS